MKTLYLFILSFIIFTGISAQNLCKLEEQNEIMHVNNVRTIINNNGSNFTRDKIAEFRVRYKDANTPSSIYTTALMFSALDAAGDIKIKALTYTNNKDCGYTPGPWYEGNEQEQYDFSEKWNKIFKVTGQEILTHIEDAKDGVIDNPIPAIFSWPGKGNSYFHDINGFDLFDNTKAEFQEVTGHKNGIYEPQFGEYPFVEGLDSASIPGAIYWSVYCTGRSKQEYKTEKIKMRLEIQQTTWAMATDKEIISDALFTRYYVTNKNNSGYYNFRFGLFVDFDLGCFLDDYIGSFPDLNSFYVYNRDNNDDINCSSDKKGYGLNPPVQAVTFLGKNHLDGFYIPLSPMGISNTEEYIRFYRMMNGKWGNEVPFTYGGDAYNPESTDTVDYVFPDDPNDFDGWSMYQERLKEEDRRALAISRKKQDPGFVFKPGDSQEYTIVYSFYRKDGTDHLGNVTFAKEQIPKLIDMYEKGLPDTGLENCDCDCLWPGDTDNNGIVNHKDIINVFKNFGNEGIKRDGNIAWSGMNAEDWAENDYTAINPKYADVDGNGIINSLDANIVKDFLGYNNLCYNHDENHHCEEGDDIQIKVSMADTVLKIHKKVELDFSIPNEKNFMGLYYEVKFNSAGIFSLFDIESKIQWDKNSANSLYYNSYNKNDSIFTVIQFNDKNRNLDIADDHLLLHMVLRTLKLPKEYPSKYIDIKICNAYIFYDDGTVKPLKTQTAHLQLPSKVKITSTGNVEQAKINIYPNPVTNTLFINSGLENDADLDIFDLSGNLIKHKTISAAYNRLEVQGLKQGMYILRITNDKINIKKKIVVINKP